MDMDFTQAIAIFLSGVLSLSMVDTLLVLSPDTETCIHAVCIRINTCTRSHGLFDERLDCFSFHVRKHADAHVTTPLHHSKDRRPFFLERTSATFPLSPIPPTFSSFFLYGDRMAFMASEPALIRATEMVRAARRPRQSA